MASSKKMRKIIIFSVIILLLLTLGGFALFRKKEPVVTVQTEKVTRRNLVETVVANGKIYPVLQVHISPEVSGEIIELPVKEGQKVKKGQLLLKINPDVYQAAVNQAKANYESSVAAKATADAALEKADTDYVRNKNLFEHKLLSESDFIGFKVAREEAQAQLESAIDLVAVAKANVDSAQDSLIKTTIVSPLDGTISQLNSQLGERVLGTVQNAGTDIMIISDLNAMEARVDVGEMDVVLIKPGQKARLEVDSYKDQKFSGVVTDIADSSEGLNSASLAGTTSSSTSGQTATQFQVRIRINEGEFFRPGMSVTADIETRSRTNALSVPIASVTTRTPKTATNSVSAGSNAVPIAATNNEIAGKKNSEAPKMIDVVFVVASDHVKMAPVKIGISDDNYWEITDGLKEGDEIVSGGYHAISHDLEDGKKIAKDTTGPTASKPPL
jgi:HlyD family secretion protein